MTEEELMAEPAQRIHDYAAYLIGLDRAEQKRQREAKRGR